MLFGKKKNQVVSAETNPQLFITKSQDTKHLGGDVTFDVPEDYAGCLIYGQESYVFYSFDNIIPQVNESCFLPKKFFTLGDTFQFYLINLNYKFDTVKTAIVDQYYFKENLPNVEIKCTFRIDLHLRLNKNNLNAVKKVIRTNSSNLDKLNQLIQDAAGPSLKVAVGRAITEQLGACNHQYEELIKPESMDNLNKRTVPLLMQDLAPFGVRPESLMVNIFTPEEGEKRLTQINDMMFDKYIDQLEHEFHDPARADLKEDREHLERMAHNGVQTTPQQATPRGNFCSQCGKPISATDKFCPSCGNKL